MQKDGFYGGYTPGWFDYALRNRRLVQKYNSLPWEDLKGKYEVLKELLAQCDEKTLIEPPFRCDHGENIYIGKNFYANYNFVVLDSAKITIGNNVVIGPNVTLSAATHPIHPESRTDGEHSFPIMVAPITIEDDVWIGAGVTILAGVTIGRGSVIGAHSLVTKDIPPMTVAVGTPCKVLRAITDADRHEWGSIPRDQQ